MRTELAKPLLHCQEFLRRRGIIVLMSDFYEAPESVINAVLPLRFHGNELILFHILDPQEIRPVLREPTLITDMETNDSMEVTPDYVKHEYAQKIDAHVEALRTEAQRNNIDYFLLDTGKPLDAALREYLTIRQGRK